MSALHDRAGLCAKHERELTYRNYSPRTLIARRHILTRLSELADLSDVTEDHIEAFISRQSLSPAARRTYLAHIRAFYKWTVRKHLLTSNPTADLDPIKVPQRESRPIQRDQLAVALAEAPRKMRAWLLLACYAGLRCTEIATLRGENLRLDQERPTITVRGKGDKVRTINAHPVLAAELATWPREGYLFPRRDGTGHVTPAYVSVRVSAYLHGLGIPSTAHKLRHRFATDLNANSAWNLRLTQYALGHASVTTTQRYVQVDDTDFAAAVGALNY